MTRFLAFLTSATLAVAVAACTGPKGDKGDPGSSGANGNNGVGALVKTSVEAAGSANCSGLGGTKIEVGIDANSNGTLDAAEVSATEYVCNGAAGGAGTPGTPGAPGTTGLVAVTPEGAGVNCAQGGQKVQSGLDANANGTLDPGEVTSTQYVCNGGGGLVGPAGSPGIPGVSSQSTGLNVNVVSVSTAAGSPIAVRFTLKDDRGYPIDVRGVYSYNTSFLAASTNSAISFSLAYAATDAAGAVQPYTVLTKSNSASNPTAQPTAFNPRTAGQGTLVENAPLGSGDYTYTFPTTDTNPGAKAVAYDPAQLGTTHTLWIQATRQRDASDVTNPQTFTAVNKSHEFIPSGVGTPVRREIVLTSNCSNCHKGFKPEGAVGAAFHSGGRVDARYCGICHNPGRVNQAANAKVFIHRIHAGHHLQPANLFHGLAATYPQDIRNCNACHAGALQGGQAQSNPTRQACGSCHDYVNFDTPGFPACIDVRGKDVATGLPTPCYHMDGAAPQPDDSNCKLCHTTAGINTKHLAINPPSPENSRNATGIPWGYKPGTPAFPAGTNNNTNAAYVAGAGSVPAGASVITYEVSSVTTVADPVPAYAALMRPQIAFKLKKDGADVVFDNPATATEIMANYVGSPSVIFAFAVPQDGIAAPADFNVTATGYIKNIWNGSAAPKTTGTATSGIGGPDGKTACTAGAPCTCTTDTPCSVSGAGTITGPDAGGFYTITLTGVQVPASAVMLTGGVGYSYSLSSAPPLVQTNVPGFPYGADGQGGIIIPAPDVWKVAAGYTGRRAIVDNSTCDTCHQPLGVAPTFHAGQRNDGPTCSFCHNPNRTSSGWSANAKDFIHALHGARKRVVPFSWHATCPPGVVCTTANATGFWDVDFPPALNTCQACHLPGMNNFASAVYTDALKGSLLSSYVATGTYTNIGSFPSPYVDATGVTNYGTGFSYSAATDATSAAAATTLFKSPITSACSACHDTDMALDHMRANGGDFYSPRGATAAISAAGPVEQCLLCHGPGRIAAIADVHK
ncbi:MAG TPA: OmcA/MtrC family decaheme c-type cytochrome [Anaeromyxobacteraceae bacterium]